MSDGMTQAFSEEAIQANLKKFYDIQEGRGFSRMDIIGQNGNDGDHYTRLYDPKSRYYDAGGIETLEVIKAKLTPEEYRGYLKGNILKYTCRMAFKHDDPSRDIEKVGQYSKYLQETIDAP